MNPSPQRKNILWLVSWYPNRNDSFDGDFVQRHARAAAIHNNIHVLYVGQAQMDEKRTDERRESTGLTEQWIYTRQKSGLFGKLKKQLDYRKAFEKGIKDYINSSGLPQLVHVHIPWKAGLLALWIKKKFGIPFLVSEHWGIYHASKHGHFSQKPVLVQSYITKILKEASVLVTVSNYLSEGIANCTRRLTDRVIPNVVDTTLFYPAREKYERFSFIHVSNMVPLKNADKILQAFALLSQKRGQGVQLLMIGNRDDRYVKMAREMGLLNTQVFFRGEIPYKEVAAEMRRAHCLVLFSEAETFSCVTAEALCTGIPVVVPRVGALPELVNEANGVLVTPSGVGALSQAMDQVMDDFGWYDPLANSKKAASKYGYNAVAGLFRELYEQFTPGKEAKERAG